jgi:hypothetical protein
VAPNEPESSDDLGWIKINWGPPPQSVIIWINDASSTSTRRKLICLILVFV